MTRFAIVTDTHIRPPGGDLSSPFPVNLKANGRAEYAIGMLAAAKPEATSVFFRPIRSDTIPSGTSSTVTEMS